MDGSEANSQEEGLNIGVCAPPKHKIIHAVMDWIADKPLHAALLCEKKAEATEGTFTSAQEQDEEAEKAKAASEKVNCIVCNKVGTRKEIATCSVCQRPRYCGVRCQRYHWRKGHK